MPFVSWAPALIGLMAIEGFGIMIFGLIWETSVQELVPEEAFGRVASLDMLGSFALLPLGYVVVGQVSYCNRWKDNNHNASYFSNHNNWNGIVCTKYSAVRLIM